jgi:hypothetical protein
MPKEWEEMTSEEKIEALRQGLIDTNQRLNDFHSEYDRQVKDYARVRETFTVDNETGKLRPKR